MAQITFDRKEVEQAMQRWIGEQYQVSPKGVEIKKKDFHLKHMSQKWITMESEGHSEGIPETRALVDDGGEQ